MFGGNKYMDCYDKQMDACLGASFSSEVQNAEENTPAIVHKLESAANKAKWWERPGFKIRFEGRLLNLKPVLYFDLDYATLVGNIQWACRTRQKWSVASSFFESIVQSPVSEKCADMLRAEIMHFIMLPMRLSLLFNIKDDIMDFDPQNNSGSEEKFHDFYSVICSRVVKLVMIFMASSTKYRTWGDVPGKRQDLRIRCAIVAAMCIVCKIEGLPVDLHRMPNIFKYVWPERHVSWDSTSASARRCMTLLDYKYSRLGFANSSVDLKILKAGFSSCRGECRHAAIISMIRRYEIKMLTAFDYRVSVVPSLYDGLLLFARLEGFFKSGGVHMGDLSGPIYESSTGRKWLGVLLKIATCDIGLNLECSVEQLTCAVLYMVRIAGVYHSCNGYFHLYNGSIDDETMHHAHASYCVEAEMYYENQLSVAESRDPLLFDSIWKAESSMYLSMPLCRFVPAIWKLYFVILQHTIESPIDEMLFSSINIMNIFVKTRCGMPLSNEEQTMMALRRIFMPVDYRHLPPITRCDNPATDLVKRGAVHILGVREDHTLQIESSYGPFSR